MSQKFNENLIKALKATEEALVVCKQALEEANDESCRAMYAGMIKDCSKHLKMLEGEVEMHKDQEKWD